MKTRILSPILIAIGIASQAVGQDLAFIGAKVEVGDGTIVENATVVVSGDRIVSVTPGGSAPAGATSIDAKGLVVYPGFVDGYTTSFVKLPEVPAGATPPNTTVTAPPTMWAENRKGIRSELKAADLIQWDDLVKSTQCNGIVMVHVALGSGLLRGTTCLALASDAKSVAERAVGAEFSFRSSGGGAGGGRSPYPGSLLGVIALMRQMLIDGQQYDGTKKDESLESLKPALGGRMPGIFVAATELEISRSLRLANEFGIKPMIAGGRDAYKRIDQLKELKIPVIASLSIGTSPSTVSSDTDGPPLAVREERVALWEERSKNIQQLMEAGVDVVFSTDGEPYSEYLKNVRTLISRGLPKASALKALTNAKVFGISDAGAVAAGKRASLTILSGDFAESKSEVRYLVVGGKLVTLKKEATK